MKRYVVGMAITGLLTHDDEDGYMAADIHAWALKHKATVEGMEHDTDCMLNEAGGWRDMSNPLDRPHCDCRVRDALREIEELLK